MSSKSGTNSLSASTREEVTTNRDHRDGERRDRHQSSRRTTEDASAAGLTRDSRSSKDTKDYNKGELRSGAPSADDKDRRLEDVVMEDKSSKKRAGDKDKPFPDTPREGGDVTSPTARTRSNSPIKRKPAPSLDQEPSRTLFVDLQDNDDGGMDSSTSSIDDLEDDYKESRLRIPSTVPLPGGIVPPPPPPPLPNRDDEELERIRLSIAQEEEEKAKIEEEKIQRLDFAMAQNLDRELNAPESPQNDRSRGGDEPPDPALVAAAAAAQHQRSSAGSRSSTSFWSMSPERQLEKLKEKYERVKAESAHYHNVAVQWQAQATHDRSNLNRILGQARQIEMELNATRKHVHHLDNELKTTKHELAAVKQQLSDAVNLSEVRGKELKGAQVFLTKADTLSVTDVVQKVHALNEEIFQMAAFLGEVLVYETLAEGVDRQAERQKEVDKYYPEAHKLLGEPLATTLARSSVAEPKEPSNPLLVQIVMGIALTQWCARLGKRWTSYPRISKDSTKDEAKDSGSHQSSRNHSEHEDFLRELYDNVRENEDQAVAGRWRSLTRAHLPFSTQSWEHGLMVGILSIMGVAGWTTRTDDEHAQIEARLASIFKPLLDLRKATGEDVTSADLEIATVKDGVEFDPTYMEDAYADGRSASGKGKKAGPETVMSTSGLGLQRIVMKKVKGVGVQRQAELLSLPKVVLEKTVKEALEPPPPTKRKKRTQGEGGSTGLLGSIGL